MKNYIKRKFREYAKENEYFLAQNAKNEDVKVLPVLRSVYVGL